MIGSINAKLELDLAAEVVDLGKAPLPEVGSGHVIQTLNPL